LESDRKIARFDLRLLPRTEQLVSVTALVIFFASGFSALLYQVIWQRMLGFFSGADVYSVTIIVAAYMAGMGVGSLTGGYLADRLSRRGNLALFASVELGIALFCAGEQGIVLRLDLPAACVSGFVTAADGGRAVLQFAHSYFLHGCFAASACACTHPFD
jgi:MFS family permease